MSDNDNGNGHKSIEQMAKEKVFNGAVVNLGELQRQDGMITTALSNANTQGMGVLQTLLRAIPAASDDDDYREIIKRGRWKNQEHRMKYIKALDLCRRTGAVKAKQLLLDMITAESAGDNAALNHEILDGLNHTTFTSREEISRKNGSNGSKSNSPIA